MTSNHNTTSWIGVAVLAGVVLIGIATVLWWPRDDQSRLTNPLQPRPQQSQLTISAAEPARSTSLLTLAPALTGFSEPRTYLLIFQNNDELRPTGGFIGVYGLITLKDGKVTEWFTADSYALDQPAEAYLDVPAPAPLAEYVNPYWFFRDANWSPDFPTAAEQLLWFYQQERGAGQPTGVIAFDPTVIERIVDVTGPLTVFDQTLDGSNLSDILQYEVEQGYYERGISRTERKAVIAELGSQLLGRLQNLSISETLQVVRTLEDMLAQKHILVYDRDEVVQNAYSRADWDGRVQQHDSDFLVVVEANMTALKTDRVVDKDIRYQVRWDGDQAIAIVTIGYEHTAPHDYRTSRLRSYVRLYVPQGSQLRNVWGAKPNDRDPGATTPLPPDIIDEFGKTSFGVFTTVEVLQKHRLLFEYVLPEYVADQLRDGSYELLVQKQPGTIGHDLLIEVPLPDGQLGSIETTLTTDLTATIE